MDGKIDLKRIAEVISKKFPDLVALQEVDRRCKRSREIDIAEELGTILGMEHRFGKFMDYQGGEYGMAILSRLPIKETIRHPLPKGAEPRCALEVRVHVEGLVSPLSFVCIHNDWTKESVRVKQVQALLGALENKDSPAILAGDFNGERTGASMQLLENNRWRIFKKNGKKTWPSDKPKVEIDFIAVRGLSIVSIEHDVIDEKVASDHRPIYAVIGPRDSNRSAEK